MGSIVVEMLNQLSEGNLSDACFEFYLSMNIIICFLVGIFEHFEHVNIFLHLYLLLNLVLADSVLFT